MQEFLDTLGDAVLPIVAVKEDGSWEPIGTCFVVAVMGPKQALALTAAHNLRRFEALDRRSPRHHPTTPREFTGVDASSIELTRTRATAVVQDASGHVAVAYVLRGWLSGLSDTAAIILDIPEDVDTAVVFSRRLAMNTRPVQEGEGAIAFGCRRMTAKFDGEPDYENQRMKINMGSEKTAPKVPVCLRGRAFWSTPHSIPG
jgi:hypothetical protein